MRIDVTKTLFAARLPWIAARVALASASLTVPAYAAAPEPVTKPGEQLADAPNTSSPTDNPGTPTDTVNPVVPVSPVAPTTLTTDPTTTITTQQPAATEEPRPWGASLSVETSVGIGTFVAEPQDNPVVVTSIAPSGYYQLAKDLKLTASFSLTWYNVLDIDTPLPENEVLMSDISLGVSHGRILHDEDSGFNLGGNLRIGLPTSLASQFQNRLFSLSTALSASIPVGPVSFSYSLGFGKYFNLTATPTLDCEDFEDEDECIQGREDNPNFGFESERRGPEVYLKGAGTNSFYVQNSLNIAWSIIDELSLSLGFTISNTFGVRSFPVDELSSEHATDGRSQRDRLMSSLGLDYTINKYVAVGASLVTDTSQPFGADGNDFPVMFDFTRASDNITSINISVTGSL